MQATYTGTVGGGQAIFSLMSQPSFAALLARALGEGAREFASSPLSFLRQAFLPDHLSDWLPARLASVCGAFTKQPFSAIRSWWVGDLILTGFLNPTFGHSATFVTNAQAPVKEKKRARNRFKPVLVASGVAHSLLIGVLVYLTILNMIRPFTNVRFVDEAYRPFTSDQITELYARSRPLAQPTDQVMSLEEMRERERKHREEMERRRAEEEAREKAEREKAEREAKEAEEKAKADEAAKKADADKPQQGIAGIAINERAIKDMVGKIYARYQAGDIDSGSFTVTIAFKIDCDGSMPRSSIKVLEASPKDPKKEQLALQILWLIGESHSFGSLCKFTSNTIRFEMDDQITRLSISGFGPTPGWVNEQATTLKSVLYLASLTQGHTDTGELLKLIKINAVNTRMDLSLTVSRQRASEMMRARYGNTPQTQ